MRRGGSRRSFFVQRMPTDVREKAIGHPLALLGYGFVFVTPNGSVRAVRFSIRTADPSEIKTRQTVATANPFGCLHDDAPAHLSHKPTTALEVNSTAFGRHQNRTRSVAVVHTPGVGWEPAN